MSSARPGVDDPNLPRRPLAFYAPAALQRKLGVAVIPYLDFEKSKSDNSALAEESKFWVTRANEAYVDPATALLRERLFVKEMFKRSERIHFYVSPGKAPIYVWHVTPIPPATSILPRVETINPISKFTPSVVDVGAVSDVTIWRCVAPKDLATAIQRHPHFLRETKWLGDCFAADVECSEQQAKTLEGKGAPMIPASVITTNTTPKRMLILKLKAGTTQKMIFTIGTKPSASGAHVLLRGATLLVQSPKDLKAEAINNIKAVAPEIDAVFPEDRSVNLAWTGNAQPAQRQVVSEAPPTAAMLRSVVPQTRAAFQAVAEKLGCNLLPTNSDFFTAIVVFGTVELLEKALTDHS